MFPTALRRAGESLREKLSKRAPITFGNNPYKTRKVWPPDFKELSPQQQLRFEKKYKRRIVLASRSPLWDKSVRFAQLGTITFALIYLLFYSEFEWWGRKYKPSDEIRKHTANLFGVLDPEKRFERRKDGPEPFPPSEDDKSK